MKIYDGFTFYNELDMLRVRLVEHDPFVDYFIIVEGDKTFSGKPKPFYFNANDPRFSCFRDKIISVKINLDSAPCDPWANEKKQRDGILRAATPEANDLILIGDVDEIVGRQHWPKVLSGVQRQEAVAIRMLTTYYYINLLLSVDCTATKIYKFKVLKEKNLSGDGARWCSWARPLPSIYGITRAYGWHFSFIGAETFIRNKIEAFSHQEYNSEEWKGLDRIREVVQNRKWLFGDLGRFVSFPVNDSWPLEMLANPVWKTYTEEPDPVMFRLRALFSRH